MESSNLYFLDLSIKQLKGNATSAEIGGWLHLHDNYNGCIVSRPAVDRIICELNEYFDNLRRFSLRGRAKSIRASLVQDSPRKGNLSVQIGKQVFPLIAVKAIINE